MACLHQIDTWYFNCLFEVLVRGGCMMWIMSSDDILQHNVNQNTRPSHSKIAKNFLRNLWEMWSKNLCMEDGWHEEKLHRHILLYQHHMQVVYKFAWTWLLAVGVYFVCCFACYGCNVQIRVQSGDSNPARFASILVNSNSKPCPCDLRLQHMWQHARGGFQQKCSVDFCARNAQ